MPDRPKAPQRRKSGATAPATPATGLEEARLGYQTAVSLWTHEGNLIWSKFNAMLVANSIVLAGVGFVSNSSSASVLLRTGLSLVGLALCFFWLQFTKRGFDYYTYWVLSARELEEKYLSGGVEIVSRGGRFADGAPVELEISGRTVSLRMSRMSRGLRTAWGSYAVVACFMVLYALQLF